MFSKPFWLNAAVLGVVAVLAGAILLPVSAVAEASSPDIPFVLTLRGDETPETVRKTLETLSTAGRKVEIRIASKDQAPTTALRDTSSAAAPRADGQPPDETPLEAFWNHVGDGLTSGLLAVPGMVELPGVLQAAWERNRNGASGLPAGWRVAASLVLALAAAGLFRLVTAGWFERRLRPREPQFISRLAASAWTLPQDLLTLGLALYVQHVLRNLWLPESDLARTTLQVIANSATVCVAYLILGRFLLAPDAAERRVMPLPRADRHFRLLALYAVASQALVAAMNLARQVGGPNTFAGLFAVGAFTLMLFKVWWFINARHDLEALILGARPKPGPGQRIVAAAAGWLYAVCFVALWLVGSTAVVMENGDRWVQAGSWTQVIIVLTPILAVGVTSLMASRQAQAAMRTETTPLSIAIGHAARAAAWGAICAGGFLLLARHWAGFWFDVSSEQFTALTRQIGGIAVLAFVCWVALVFLRSYFDAYAPKRPASMPGDEDEMDEYMPSRLTTVMPVLRGVVIFVVLGIAMLVLLSQLGVDTGPLLAGFGLLGLALSFGSRDLIRDVVSGFFFMLEDAFRVGEYVDTGRLKGTVEKISLRSMQLRHQSGQIHTVSFGPLSSLTNASRDWATVKFNVRLDHGADIEMARKTIKKIGLALLEDPEFGPYFILPLKMQGVADITDAAIVIRLKFTAKPNQASMLQREALKRVYRGLNEVNVPFASNAVTVKEGTSRGAAAATAAMPPPTPLASGGV
jgi:small-conductance mechanosensitive channel